MTFAATGMYAELLAPSGASVSSLVAAGQRRSELVMSETGTHVLLVHACNLFNTGVYEMDLEGLVPPAAVEAALTLSVAVSADISSGAEMDVFTYAGTAAEDLTLSVTGGSVIAFIYDPSGAELARVTGGSVTVPTLTRRPASTRCS